MSRTRDFASTDPANLRTACHDEIVIAYSVVHQMDSLLWHYRDKHDAWEDDALKAEARKLDERQKALGLLYMERFRERMYLVQFRGCIDDSDHELSHYDIETELQKHWTREQISCDSESGGFYVDTIEGVREDVERFLRSTFPTLNFSVFDYDADDELFDPRPPMFGGWNVSEKFLAEREITVDYTPPVMSMVGPDRMAELMTEAREALRKTGLGFEDAVAVLRAVEQRTV